jgi:hypothetical protein
MHSSNDDQGSYCVSRLGPVERLDDGLIIPRSTPPQSWAEVRNTLEDGSALGGRATYRYSRRPPEERARRGEIGHQLADWCAARYTDWFIHDSDTLTMISVAKHPGASPQVSDSLSMMPYFTFSS